MHKVIAILLLTMNTIALGQNWGLRRPQNWKKLAKWDDLRMGADTLPAKFNWNEIVQLQPIRNQASCGSCWAFSVTAVTESLYWILAYYQDNHLFDLAEQTLVSSCEQGGSCGGGFFDAFNYVRDVGLPDESQDPYRAQNSSCKPGLKPIQKIKDWRYVGNENRGPSTEQIKAAIYEHGPVSVDVNGSFGGYSGGVYTSCGSTGTNHMVTIEGWVDDAQYANYGGGYWLMRNSWGTNWGDHGYMKIVYKSRGGSNCNGIGNTAAYATLPQLDQSLRSYIAHQ